MCVKLNVSVLLQMPEDPVCQRPQSRSRATLKLNVALSKISPLGFPNPNPPRNNRISIKMVLSSPLMCSPYEFTHMLGKPPPSKELQVTHLPEERDVTMSVTMMTSEFNQANSLQTLTPHGQLPSITWHLHCSAPSPFRGFSRRKSGFQITQSKETDSVAELMVLSHL